MDEDQKHYPPGAEPEPSAEPPQPEEKPAEAPAPEPEAEKPEEKKPEETKPDAEKPKDDPSPKPEVKKRSIYDDLKEERNERKEATARAEAAEARNAELEALLKDKDTAATPTEKKEAKDAIDEWAEKNGLDGKSVRELTDIIKGALPKPEGSVMTEDEVKEWRAERARSQAAAEDAAVLKDAPAVRKQLEEFGAPIHDETELQAVMAEVVKLSHTREFHDKPVDYIVYANRDALKKMISPRKASFEQGGQAGVSEATGDVEFNGKMTPMQAEQAVHDRGRGSAMDIRRGA